MSKTFNDIANKHKKRIEEQNKKYPLMEYFLSNKPLEECGPECQKQVAELREEGSNAGLPELSPESA